MQQLNSSSSFPRSKAIRLAVALALFGVSGSAAAQSSAANDALRSDPVAQQAALAPSVPSAPVATEPASAPVASRSASSVMLGQRPVGLTRRVSTDSTAPAPMMKRAASQTNTALMIVGAAAVILGATIDDNDASTILIIGGAGIGLYGLYRFLN